MYNEDVVEMHNEAYSDEMPPRFALKYLNKEKNSLKQMWLNLANRLTWVMGMYVGFYYFSIFFTMMYV